MESICPKPSTSGGTGRLPPRDTLPHKLRGSLNLSIDSGKSLTHCEFTFHSFSTSRSGTHRAGGERARASPSLDQEIRQAPGSPGVAANLPRFERILPCTPDQRVCKRCGKETVVIGYEESSQLDVEPARYFVLVTKREKRACRSCEKLGVVSAPLPPGSSRSAWRVTGSSSRRSSANTAITRRCIGRA